jgi:hypothetical protein
MIYSTKDYCIRCGCMAENCKCDRSAHMMKEAEMLALADDIASGGSIGYEQRQAIADIIRTAARPAPTSAAEIKQTCGVCNGKGGRHGDGFDHHFYTCEKCNGTGLGNSSPAAGVIERAAETLCAEDERNGGAPWGGLESILGAKAGRQAKERYRDAAKAVLTLLSQRVAGEPVAWRWKFNGVWYFGATPPDRYPDAEPLYASPAPSGRDPATIEALKAGLKCAIATCDEAAIALLESSLGIPSDWQQDAAETSVLPRDRS